MYYTKDRPDNNNTKILSSEYFDSLNLIRDLSWHAYEFPLIQFNNNVITEH